MTDVGTINVLGNGFDVAHGLKTSYWDFWEYLKKVILLRWFSFVKMYFPI